MTNEFALSDLVPGGEQVTVLDVGAMAIGSGGPIYAPLYGYENFRVLGFEPDETECRKLNESSDNRFHFYPHFAGDGGKATYFETNMTMTGSLYEPNTRLLEKFQNLAELTTVVATHQVATMRLDDIEGLDDVDLFKIDVQGAELKVFENATRVLSAATVIHTEVEFVEMYKGQPLFADVDKFLRAEGFQFHTFHNYGSRCFKPITVENNINKGLNQRLWADVIYVRDFMALDELSAVKLLKMAAILNDVYQSFDLCHTIIEAADKQTGAASAKDYLARLANSGGN